MSAYIPYAIARARKRQRGEDTERARSIAQVSLLEVPTLFADVCTWATEPELPFVPHVPRVVTLMRRDLVASASNKRERGRRRA
jgi:hypothetical protein